MASAYLTGTSDEPQYLVLIFDHTNLPTERDDYYAELAAEFREYEAQYDAHVVTYGFHLNNLRLAASGRQPNPSPVLEL